jgi:N-acyl-D-amino-acid deacylase
MKILFQNCLIYDGSGSPPVSGDVLTDGDRIADAGPVLSALRPDRTIDGGGLALAPGFIDAHGHSDLSILAAPEATGKISQGVTTEITGNCGLSPFPVTERNRDHLNHLYANYGVEITWRDFAGYAAETERRRPAINIAPLCGHNTLRGAVCGYRDEPFDIEQAAALLREQLRQGAAGFSTGLLYTPGCFSAPPEITALLKVLADFKRPYTTHLRSEGNQLLEALSEAVDSCRSAGQEHLHISHFKTSGRANWHKLDDAVRLLASAPLKITADRYPYTESMTQLGIILPDELARYTNDELARHLADPVHFAEVTALLRRQPPERWQTCRLVTTIAPNYAKRNGRVFAEFPDPPLACAEILRDDPSGAMAAFRGMCPDNLRRILNLPYVMCGTDESARPVDYRFGVSHPRGFGSFPEFFGYFKLEEAIRRVTSLPAETFGLAGRGRIRRGYSADLVLFDPAAYRSEADFSHPHRMAGGIKLVLVNGGERSGRVLAR